jgi:hypothetical protein
MLNPATVQEPYPEPSKVRTEVLRQHRELRGLLQEALTFAGRELRQGNVDEVQLGHMCHEIRRRFRNHLTFEEQVLVPVLSSADTWGPERVRNLLEEHGAQRRDLDGVIEGVEGGWGKERLAQALRKLATDLLRDMEEEERDYLSPNLLRDDLVVVDQVTD